MKAVMECYVCGNKEEVDWNGTSSHMLQLRCCPDCGMGRIVKSIDCGPRISGNTGSPSFGRIAGMTPSQRKELLKERSTRDFHKNVEARKRWIEKQSISTD